MTNEFKLGYIAARDNARETELDDKSPEFIRGFTQFMHEQALLAGNDDLDTYDY